MRTTDWQFDFSSLPHWNYRNEFPYVYDDFFDIPKSNVLCCIYSICEVSMCNYVGCLAILKNKKNPELLLNITEGFTFCDNISLNTNENLIFLQPSIYNKALNVYKRPILIVDISKNVFAYFVTDNVNPCYKVVELNENVFKIEADVNQKKFDKRLNALSKKKIHINRLKWNNFDMLNSLPNLLF